MSEFRRRKTTSKHGVGENVGTVGDRGGKDGTMVERPFILGSCQVPGWAGGFFSLYFLFLESLIFVNKQVFADLVCMSQFTNVYTVYAQ